MTCMRISQMIAAAPTAEADAPTPDHGETDDKPSPVPNESRITARAADTNAPATTAAQDTPEERASIGPYTSGRMDVSTIEVCGREVTGVAVEYSISICLSEGTAKSDTSEPNVRYAWVRKRAIHRRA